MRGGDSRPIRVFEREDVLLMRLTKVDHSFEALLLEILSAWQITVPKRERFEPPRFPLSF